MRQFVLALSLLFSVLIHAQGYYATPDQNVYTLDPEMVGIVQGTVSDAVALQNRKAINQAFQEAYEANYKIFAIDSLEAYFDIVTLTEGRSSFTPRLEAIRIPGPNITLKMSDDTHLRAQPNNAGEYELMTNNLHDNVTITGGNLWGDRNQHDYSGDGGGEHGHVLVIRGGENCLVDGVVMKEGSGDGLDVKGLNFFYDANYNETRNLVVRNCIIDSNRRNNISITDGYHIIIENNQILNAGVDTPTSQGTAPQFGIDIEPYAEDNDAGVAFYYEHIEDITIRNNIERGSVKGATIIVGGDTVMIENNNFETGIGYKHANNVTIRNNLSENHNPEYTDVSGIFAGPTREKYKGNEIYGNTVIGFKNGMTLVSNNHDVHDNTFRNFKTGLYLKGYLNNTDVYDNTFESSAASSDAAFFYLLNADSVSVRNNTFESSRFAFRMDQVESENLNFEGNTIVSPNYTANLRRTSGVNVFENTFNTGFEIDDSSDLLFEGNTLNSGNKDTFRFRNAQSNDVKIIGNTINTTARVMRQDIEPVNLIFEGNTVNGAPQE